MTSVTQFAAFYFSVGWLVMTGIGCVAGWYASMTRRWGVLAIYLVIALLAGGVAIYGKTGA